MPAIRHDDVLLRLIRDVNDIRSVLKRSVANLPLYDIDNENTPAQLTADQNNYVPGNYDVLRISSDAERTITGISNGVKGRKLQIYNVGNFNITLAYQSALSTDINRFTTPSQENVVLYPNSGVRLYYDGVLKRWNVPDTPAWAGSFGYSLFVVNGVLPSIASGGDQLLTFDTVRNDDWNMWDSANNRIVIPQDGCYMGILGGNFEPNATGYRALRWEFNGNMIYSQDTMALTGGFYTSISCSYFYNHLAGENIKVYASQNSGSALDLYNQYIGFVRVR